MDVAVAVNRVSRIYVEGAVETRVLEDITLSVACHGYIALMGPSGSGKTTLLNLISGLDRPTAGSVEIFGTDLSLLGEDALSEWRSRNVGFIFQQYHLLSVLTCFENVELPLLLFAWKRRERRERVMAALEVVGLADRADFFPRQLSGGQKQRTGIARAIVTDPPLVIADEPTGNLDERSSGQVLDLFDMLHRRLGKTFVMVTHDPKAAERAQRVLHLEKGVLSRQSSPSEPYT